MNIALTKWKDFLNESKKSLILEFNKDDRDAVMDSGENFTISYEIELESIESMITGKQGKSPETAMEELSDEMEIEFFLDGPRNHESSEEAFNNVLHYFNDYNYSSRLDLDDDNINIALLPYIFGCEAAIMTGKGPGLIFGDLNKGFKDLNKVDSFLDAAFGSAALMSLEQRSVIDEMIYKAAPDLKEEPLWDMKQESVVDAYVKKQLEEEDRNKFLRIVSGLMPKIFKEFFADVDVAGDIDIPADPYHSFLVSTFYSVFGATASFQKLYEVGFDIIYYVADSSDSVTDFLVNMREESAKYITPKTYIVDFIDFYIEGTTEYLESYVEDFREELGINDTELDIDNLETYEIEEQYRIALSEHLPNFYYAYGDVIKVESDGSLGTENGLEFSMESYISGLEEAYAFLDVFYNDYEDQDFFFMSHNTGMHINVGYLDVGSGGEGDFNLIKGYLFLNEEEMARKGLDADRTNSRWAKAITKEAKAMMLADSMNFMEDGLGFAVDPEYVTKTSKQFMEALRKGEISEIEETFSNILDRKAAHIGSKNLGFNINYAREKEGDEDIKYIEFRYPGHEVTKDTAKDLTAYYCYIVMTMAEPTFKIGEYIKKFIGLLSETAAQRAEITKSFVKYFKPGRIIYLNPKLIPGNTFDNVIYVDPDIGDNISVFGLWEWLVNLADKNYETIPRTRQEVKEAPARILNIVKNDGSNKTDIGYCELEYYFLDSEGYVEKIKTICPIYSLAVSFGIHGFNNALSPGVENRRLDRDVRIMLRQSPDDELTLLKNWKKVDKYLQEHGKVKYKKYYTSSTPPGLSPEAIKFSKYYNEIYKAKARRGEFRGGAGFDAHKALVAYAKENRAAAEEFVKYSGQEDGERTENYLADLILAYLPEKHAKKDD